MSSRDIKSLNKYGFTAPPKRPTPKLTESKLYFYSSSSIYSPPIDPDQPKEDQSPPSVSIPDQNPIHIPANSNLTSGTDIQRNTDSNSSYHFDSAFPPFSGYSSQVISSSEQPLSNSYDLLSNTNTWLSCHEQQNHQNWERIVENETQKDLATRRAALSSTSTFPTICSVDSMNEALVSNRSSQKFNEPPLPFYEEQAPTIEIPESKRITKVHSINEVEHTSDLQNFDQRISFPATINRDQDEAAFFSTRSKQNQYETDSFPIKAKSKNVTRAKKEAKEHENDDIAKEDDELSELIDSLHSSVSESRTEGPTTEIESVWDRKIKEFQELQKRKQKALREVGKAGEESVVGSR